jgi:hypothetical protein
VSESEVSRIEQDEFIFKIPLRAQSIIGARHHARSASSPIRNFNDALFTNALGLQTLGHHGTQGNYALRAAIGPFESALEQFAEHAASVERAMSD